MYGNLETLWQVRAVERGLLERRLRRAAAHEAARAATPAAGHRPARSLAALVRWTAWRRPVRPAGPLA